MASLVLQPCLTDKLIVVVDKSTPTGKLPSRLSSPTEEASTPTSDFAKLEQRGALAEANHQKAIRARQARAEALGSKRVEAVLSKRSEKEQAALRALAERMASADEKRDHSKKLQALKFERARFLRQAANDARAKMEDALKEKAESDAAKMDKAAAKRAALLAAIATTNAAKYQRAKEVVALVRSRYSLEEAERALTAKLEAHAAAREDKVDAIVADAKAHNEHVRTVTRRALAARLSDAAELETATRRKEAAAAAKREALLARTVAKAAKENVAAQVRAEAAQAQAKEAEAEALRVYYARLQRAELNREAALATPTKQAKARRNTRQVEARELDLAAQGLVFVEPAKRSIKAALEERLCAMDTKEARAAVQLKAQRRAIGASGRVAARRSLVVGKAKQMNARVEAAAARRAGALAALAQKLADKAARANVQLGKVAAARKDKAAKFAGRRSVAAYAQAQAKALRLGKLQAEADAVRAALARHAKLRAQRRAAGLRYELAARRAEARRAANVKIVVSKEGAAVRRAKVLKAKVNAAKKFTNKARFAKK